MPTATDFKDYYAILGVSKTAKTEEIKRVYRKLAYAALMTETSITLVKFYVELGVIEPKGSMLHKREIARIAQIQRLRKDLGLNLVGAAMVLDMATEIAQLRAQLKVYQSRPECFAHATRTNPL